MNTMMMQRTLYKTKGKGPNISAGVVLVVCAVVVVAAAVSLVRLFRSPPLAIAGRSESSVSAPADPGGVSQGGADPGNAEGGNSAPKADPDPAGTAGPGSDEEGAQHPETAAPGDEGAEPQSQGEPSGEDGPAASQGEAAGETAPPAPVRAVDPNPDLPLANEGLKEDAPAYQFLYPELRVQRPTVRYLPPEEKVVYLTFDDGPCSNTDLLLDTLDSLDIKVTFFVTKQHGSDEEVVAGIRKMHDRGHKVAVHTYLHDYRTIYSSVEAYLEDYEKMDALILQGTGERSGLYRFPGGSNTSYNEGIREAMMIEMNRRGFVYYDWNASNGDSEYVDAPGQIERTVQQSSSQNHAIVLMHDAPDKPEVISTLPEIVGQLRDLGYRFEILDETVKPIQFSIPIPVG